MIGLVSDKKLFLLGNTVESKYCFMVKGVVRRNGSFTVRLTARVDPPPQWANLGGEAT